MEKKDSKFVAFLRKNAAYFVLALCIIAIGLSVSISLIVKNNQPSIEVTNPDVTDTPTDNVIPDEPSGPVDSPVDSDTPVDKPVVEVITFIMPVENCTEIERYSDTMVWNSTLNRYSSHMATDFFASEGTAVLCVYDGVIKSVDNSILKGVTVTIEHKDGLTTVYNSLADADTVSVGQQVKAGDVIGHVSLSNRQESGSGAHLHFEVLEDGVSIDPIKYMSFEEK